MVSLHSNEILRQCHPGWNTSDQTIQHKGEEGSCPQAQQPVPAHMHPSPPQRLAHLPLSPLSAQPGVPALPSREAPFSDRLAANSMASSQCFHFPRDSPALELLKTEEEPEVETGKPS